MLHTFFNDTSQRALSVTFSTKSRFLVFAKKFYHFTSSRITEVL